MKYAYVVNGKSVALSEKIEKAIAEQNIPLSLFRATLLNAIRKIRDGHPHLVNFEALQDAVLISLPKYRGKVTKMTKLTGHADVTLRKIKRALVDPSQENMDALLKNTGFIPACSIKNFKMLSVLLKRRIYDIDFISDIETTMGSLNSLKGTIPDKHFCLRHYSNKGTVPEGMYPISSKQSTRHNLRKIPAVFARIIYESGKTTLLDLGFDVERSIELSNDKYYVYYVTYQNITIPCPVTIKGNKKHDKNDRCKSNNPA